MDTIKTVDDIMAERPCDDYTREVVAELVGDGITAVQCAALDIPIEDRLWAIIYVWLDDRQRRLFAADCAERALECERAAGRERDERSWEAIRVARAYARGGSTDEELDAAWDAAWDGAMDARAARAAAQSAARDARAAWAAWAAARDAAWYAAWAATRDGAMDARAARAAWAAARAAELRWQIDRALEYIITNKDQKEKK
jgi:hypothetical protein